jgi:hypothetical protein
MGFTSQIWWASVNVPTKMIVWPHNVGDISGHWITQQDERVCHQQLQKYWSTWKSAERKRKQSPEWNQPLTDSVNLNNRCTVPETLPQSPGARILWDHLRMSRRCARRPEDLADTQRFCHVRHWAYHWEDQITKLSPRIQKGFTYKKNYIHYKRIHLYKHIWPSCFMMFI